MTSNLHIINRLKLECLHKCARLPLASIGSFPFSTDNVALINVWYANVLRIKASSGNSSCDGAR